MRVLVACEFSGIVRTAFRWQGHNAWSCDLLPAEDQSPYHIQGDVLGILGLGWDLLIAHPPCTHLAVSGARWFNEKRLEQALAAGFFYDLAEAPIPRICVENPIGVMSRLYRKPDQIVHPFHFGDPFRKSTCLWLKGLPKLTRTSSLTDGKPECHHAPPGPDRWKDRSRTYPGIAQAMASQWG